ncbi:MAG: NAD-dependent succinate-semialdehyde dehydrogenase [Phototrophicaceae bacterium]|jgi:acyl-CoA reductase-like NAD-dependent aldehyde dehydrogenase
MPQTEFPSSLYINGKWVPAINDQTWTLINPATETPIENVPYGDGQDAQAAIDAAAEAFPAWSHKTPYERAEILLRAAQVILDNLDAFARTTTEESGKPLKESLGEWRSSTNYLRFYAEEGKRLYGRTIPAMQANRRISVIRQPLGVVGTITAWNFPIYNVMRAGAAALAAGCTVVARPSEYTPRTAMRIAAAFAEAGLPAGVYNVVNGEPESIAQVMLNDPRLRKIHFTGSTRVGKLLMDGASATLTQLSLELGGNAPVLIMPDIKDKALREAARRSVMWKFRNAGQVCIAPQRFFVPFKQSEAYIEHVIDAVKGLRVGNGMDDGIDMGPMINARQRDRVDEMVKQAHLMGAKLLRGGGMPAGVDRGYFYAPTILSHVRPEMTVYHEEIFGPVMPIISYDDPEQALAMANDTPYGLAAFVLTNDLNTSIMVSEQLQFGMVCINDWLPATPEAPFVGTKQSGVGAESGPEGVTEYTELKTIYIGNVG